MPQLFMIKLGGRPKGRLIEQHDVFFGVGEQVSDFIDPINHYWPEVKNKWHLDAYRTVTVVDHYHVHWQPTVVSAYADEEDAALKLFFINLGGYVAGAFEEYHHKLLIVAHSQAEAMQQARQSPFYQQYSVQDKATPFNAAAHIDDKHQVDVDEIYDVNDLLTAGRLFITPFVTSDKYVESPQADQAYIGYLSLKKLRQLSTAKQM